MADEEKKSSMIKDTAEIVKGIVEAVPVYQDALQPLAKETGKALGTVGQAINTALLPLKALIWGFDRIEAFFNRDVSERLKNVPPDQIITPDPIIAGPAIEALRYAGEKESLRDLYAGLLAGAMNAKTADDAHPAYVEVLRQLSAQDAQNLRYFEDSHLVYEVTVLITDEETPALETQRLQGGITGFAGEVGGDFIVAGRGDLSGKLRSISVEYKSGQTFPHNLKRLGLIAVMHQAGQIEVPYNDLLSDDLILDNEARIRASGRHPFSLCNSYYLETFGRSFMVACGLCPYGNRSIDQRLKEMMRA